jgi:GT2 family glycosyltransferase
MKPDTSRRVCVIVVNYRAGALLVKCLDSIASQAKKPDRVLVIDNASEDAFFDKAKTAYPQFEFIALEENTGFAFANNLGAKMADDCGWIALLNPDAFAQPDWLGKLFRAASANTSFTFFASRSLRASQPDIVDSAGDVYHVSGKAWSRGNAKPASHAFLENDEVFGPSAAAAMYRRDVFLESGGFDESFFCYMEDVDLAFRLRLANHKCLYVADAIVHHEGSSSAGRMSDFFVYHSARNMVWTFMKNMPTPMLAGYFLQFLALNILSIPAYAASGRLFAAMRGKWSAFMGLPGILRKRKTIMTARKASISSILKTMSRGLLAPYSSWLSRNRRSG